MVLLIDNYDSFTYILSHLCTSFVDNIQVVRNDKISISEIEAMNPKAIIISPGPKSPAEAGICIELVQAFAPKIPILGICLGMQAIGAAYGANVVRSSMPMHGKTSAVQHSGKLLYKDIPHPMKVGRYHSLMLEKSSLPPVIIQEACTADGVIMGIRHRDYPCYGVQFHPESVMTEGGDVLVGNFFRLAQEFQA